MLSRLATSVRQVTRDQMELGPTESDMGRSRFLLSSGCDRDLPTTFRSTGPPAEVPGLRCSRKDQLKVS